MLRFTIFCVAWLAVCFGHAAEITLTVLATTDIHGAIENPGRDGDWLRLATLIKRERAAQGEDRVLLIDSGDTLQGSLAGALSRGEAPSRLMDHLRYDAWALGNHDLDYGTARLVELIAASKTPVLSGNLTLHGRQLPAYTVVERGGARVAIIGMNSWFLRHWLWGDDLRDYSVTPAIEALETVLPQVMAERPDAIILALHGGWGTRTAAGDMEIFAIGKRFPQIDLVLGGHSHKPVAGQVLRSGWFVQAGAHGRGLARVRLTIDTEAHRVLRKESILLTVPPGTPADPEARAVVADWLDRADAASTEVLATPPVAVTPDGLPGEDCMMSEMLCRAIAAAAPDCDAVLHGRHNRYYWSADREVTLADIFITIPYENRLATISVTPAELRLILDEQLTRRPRYYRHGIWGLEAVRGVSGHVVALRDRDGNPWPEDRRITLALNSFVLAGSGGRNLRLAAIGAAPAAQATDLHLSARDALAAYLRGSPDWSPPRRWFGGEGAPAGGRDTSATESESDTDEADSELPH